MKVLFFRVGTKMHIISKRINSDRLLGLTSLLLISFFLSLKVALNSSKHGCNKGKEEELCFALRIIHVFVHA